MPTDTFIAQTATEKNHNCPYPFFIDKWSNNQEGLMLLHLYQLIEASV